MRRRVCSAQWVVLCGVSALSGMLAGCDCPTEEKAPPVDYVAPDGPRGGVYESTPWDGKWLYFPAGRTYRLHHGLGVKPETRGYLSFDEENSGLEGQSSSASGAGNAMAWADVNEQFIDVNNGTCANFYLRVVATATSAEIPAEINQSVDQ